MTHACLHGVLQGQFLRAQVSMVALTVVFFYVFFQELAPKYFAHLAAAMRDGQRTCLAKIMGVYTVRGLLLANWLVQLPCMPYSTGWHATTSQCLDRIKLCRQPR